MSKTLDLTDTLKVVGVTLLSLEQAKLVPKRDRKASCDWWLRTPTHNFWSHQRDNNGGRVGSISFDGYITTEEPVYVNNNGIRPALLISNLDALEFSCVVRLAENRNRFLYKGLEWKVCPFNEGGYAVALCTDVIKNKGGNAILTAFRKCKVPMDWEGKTAATPDGKPIDWEDLDCYDHSDLKKTFDKWVNSSGIVNSTSAKPEDICDWHRTDYGIMITDKKLVCLIPNKHYIWRQYALAPDGSRFTITTTCIHIDLSPSDYGCHAIYEGIVTKDCDTPDAEDPVLVTHCIGLAGCLEYLHKNHGASWGTWTVAVAHNNPAGGISIARVTGTKAKVKEYLLKLASDPLAKSNRKGLTEEEWNKRLELYSISADKIQEFSDRSLLLVASYEDKYLVTYAAAPETEAITL